MSKRKTLQIGDVVRHPKYGMGRIHQIDPNDRELFFDIHFDIDGGDGTLIWMDKIRALRQCKLVHRPDTPPAVVRLDNGIIREFVG